MAIIFGGSPLARSISGTHVTVLTSPISKEIQNNAKRAATDSLLKDLALFINEQEGTRWDTSNTLVKAHLSIILDKCLQKAESSSKLVVRDWFFSLSVSEENLKNVITQYSLECDSTAVNAYKEALLSFSNQDYVTYYTNLLTTIVNEMGHVGTALPLPDDSTGKFLVTRAKEKLSEMLRHVSMSVTNLILHGKPGLTPDNKVLVSVKYDSVALDDLCLKATLATGRTMLLSKTDNAGQISMADLGIPFVVNGSFLLISLDPSSDILFSSSWNLKDLGLLAPIPEQMLMFKIDPPMCTIHYTVNSVNDLAVPADFLTSAYLEKYLKDSCNLRIAGPTDMYDLVFDITVQLSRYEFEPKSETRCKTEGSIMIQSIRNSKKALVKQGTIFEKAYETGVDIPYGAFFWESSAKLRSMLRLMLNDI